MKERKLDFLSRREVKAVILITSQTKEHLISKNLPQGYYLDNGIFRFPAGFWNSYFVNGKEYNVDGNRSVEEQQDLIKQDLIAEGFSSQEAEDFIAEIEVKEGSPMMLTFEASNKWLKYYPEFEQKAFQVLKETKNELLKEQTGGFHHEMRKK